MVMVIFPRLVFSARVLFPTVHRDGLRRTDNLITKIHRNFKKISGDADIHGGLQCHADSIFKLKEFTSISANLQQRIGSTISQRSQERVHKTGTFYSPFFDALNLLVDSVWPFGVIVIILLVMVTLVRVNSKQHLESCLKNARYLSNTAQNQLILCTGDELTATIVREIKKSHFYGIQADEVTDLSGRKQLSILVRYEKEGEAVEKLIAFVEFKSVTGSSISSKILSELQRVVLDPKRCRAQTCDGVGSMSGHLNGCQAKLRQVVPEARYFHCSSHQLNLALTKACAVKSV